MGIKTLAIQHEYIKNNYDELLEAFKRSNACNTADTTLGESLRIRTLAATGCESLDAMFDSAEVVYVSKRAMVVKMGIVLFTFGKYGVATCALPTGIKASILAFAEGPSLFPDQYEPLITRLGAVRDIYDRGDWVYDYSACKQAMRAAA